MNLKNQPRLPHSQMSSPKLSSLTPHTKTTLILIKTNPTYCTTSIPSITKPMSPQQMICLNQSKSNISQKTLIHYNPTSTNNWTNNTNNTPFIIITTSSIPNIFTIILTNLTMSFQTNNSPPINQIFCIPYKTKTRTRRCISSNVRRLTHKKNYIFSIIQ